MINRGVRSDVITIVPNAVDPHLFVPRERDRELERQLGVEEACVIGFVGTLTHYEGLDDLLRAGARLKHDSSTPLKYLFVGDGPATLDLVSLAEELGLASDVCFTGRVSPRDVHRYLSVIDITPFPRKPFPVTELVSPLKPLESMASGIPVIVSDVAALREMVPEGAGLIFEKGNLESLTTELGGLIDDPTLRRELSSNAREWVLEHRTWEAVSRPLAEVYEALTGQ